MMPFIHTPFIIDVVANSIQTPEGRRKSNWLKAPSVPVEPEIKCVLASRQRSSRPRADCIKVHRYSRNQGALPPLLHSLRPNLIEPRELRLAYARKQSSWLDVALRYLASANGESNVVEFPGCFAWYELMTTDMAAAETFYGNVVGWGAQDASTPNLAYTVFTAGKAPLGGLIDLPEEGRKMGAWPRWMGYVEVNDVEVTAGRIKRLGGAVHVPPTQTNIGLISVVTDPQTTTFGLISGLKHGRPLPAESGKSGRVGWHELLAADWEKAFAFYAEILGWRKADSAISETVTYQLFSAGGLVVGGMFTKRPEDPFPFWLFYFNVEDIDAAMKRVKSGGGRVMAGSLELPDGSWIARCADPQGATFALQGNRAGDPRLGWSTAWSGFSSRGRLLAPKPRDRAPGSDSES